MDKEEFNYTYSAPTVKERMELESIKKEYGSKTEKETKMERVRKLDKTVKEIPTVTSLSIGIVGVLIFGTGLTCCLEWDKVLLGIIVSITGVVVMLPAYYVYRAMRNKLRNKYASEILKLSEEILNDESDS